MPVATRAPVIQPKSNIIKVTRKPRRLPPVSESVNFAALNIKEVAPDIMKKLHFAEEHAYMNNLDPELMNILEANPVGMVPSNEPLAAALRLVGTFTSEKEFMANREALRVLVEISNKVYPNLYEDLGTIVELCTAAVKQVLRAFEDRDSMPAIVAPVFVAAGLLLEMDFKEPLVHLFEDMPRKQWEFFFRSVTKHLLQCHSNPVRVLWYRAVMRVVAGCMRNFRAHHAHLLVQYMPSSVWMLNVMSTFGAKAHVPFAHRAVVLSKLDMHMLPVSFATTVLCELKVCFAYVKQNVEESSVAILCNLVKVVEEIVRRITGDSVEWLKAGRPFCAFAKTLVDTVMTYEVYASSAKLWSYLLRVVQVVHGRLPGEYFSRPAAVMYRLLCFVFYVSARTDDETSDFVNLVAPELEENEMLRATPFSFGHLCSKETLVFAKGLGSSLFPCVLPLLEAACTQRFLSAAAVDNMLVVLSVLASCQIDHPRGAVLIGECLRILLMTTSVERSLVHHVVRQLFATLAHEWSDNSCTRGACTQLLDVCSVFVSCARNMEMDDLHQHAPCVLSYLFAAFSHCAGKGYTFDAEFHAVANSVLEDLFAMMGHSYAASMTATSMASATGDHDEASETITWCVPRGLFTLFLETSAGLYLESPRHTKLLMQSALRTLLKVPEETADAPISWCSINTHLMVMQGLPHFYDKGEHDATEANVCHGCKLSRIIGFDGNVVSTGIYASCGHAYHVNCFVHACAASQRCAEDGELLCIADVPLGEVPAKLMDQMVIA